MSPQFRRSTHLFTSESVTMGHPDKVADQISDAVLDAILTQDPKARVACETLVTTGQVVLAGEVTTDRLRRCRPSGARTIKEIGYIHPEIGFDAAAGVLSAIHSQSPAFARGVDQQSRDDTCPRNKAPATRRLDVRLRHATEPTTLMPLPIHLRLYHVITV